MKLKSFSALKAQILKLSLLKKKVTSHQLASLLACYLTTNRLPLSLMKTPIAQDFVCQAVDSSLLHF